MLKTLCKHIIYEKCIEVFFDRIYQNFINVKKYNFKAGDIVEILLERNEIGNIERATTIATIDFIRFDYAYVTFLRYDGVHLRRWLLSELRPLVVQGQAEKAVENPRPFR
jgi:hypothetical protein